MRKKKIYLDTSVVSYLRQEDAPKEMQETLEFWEILRTGKYDIYISELVVNELSDCTEPKRTELFTLLSEIEYTDTEVERNADIITLANEIRKLDIVPAKSENDRRHIAAAVYNECNAIISWNFKHSDNSFFKPPFRVIRYFDQRKHYRHFHQHADNRCKSHGALGSKQRDCYSHSKLKEI